MTDAELLSAVERTFGNSPRPDHFTNFSHCEECEEHDTLLRSRAKGELRTEDVANPGWDPICFVSYEAFRYLLPDLVRLALLPATEESDWSLPNLLFHLTYEEERNSYLTSFNPEERAVVLQILKHISATRMAAIDMYCLSEEMNAALSLWQNRV